MKRTLHTAYHRPTHPHTQTQCQQYWRERAAFQRSAFGRSTAGNHVVATIFISLLLFSPCFFPLFTPPWPFLIEGVLVSKTYLAKVDGSAQKPSGRHLAGSEWGPPVQLGWYLILNQLISAISTAHYVCYFDQFGLINLRKDLINLIWWTSYDLIIYWLLN